MSSFIAYVLGWGLGVVFGAAYYRQIRSTVERWANKLYALIDNVNMSGK